MRYIQPQITGILDAVSTIKGIKLGPSVEALTLDPTNGAAYEADE